MMTRYEQYEQACERIRNVNARLLADFRDWLTRKGLSAQTVRNHVGNIDLYVNHYLLYDTATEAVSGVYYVSSFLGHWYIRKAMWASESGIRGNAASLKKFYIYLNEQGQVPAEHVDLVRNSIKEGLPEWLATMRRYADPLITDSAEIWEPGEYG